MLLVEVVGRVGTFPPEQIVSVVPKVNVGVTTGFTTTFIVVAIPH